MTQYAYPFDSGAGSNVLESQWREMARNWLPTGVLEGRYNELAVAESSPAAMSVQVATGQAWIEGTFYWNDAAATLPVTANASGNPRIDLVVVRINLAANSWELAVLPGTPAGSPVAPTPTQNASLWEEPLYTVAVANGAVSIVNANLASVRNFVSPGGGGGFNPLLSQSFS